MKIEQVEDQEVRVQRRGPFCYVDVNVHPDRHLKGPAKGIEWKTIDRSSMTPSFAELQSTIRNWRTRAN